MKTNFKINLTNVKFNVSDKSHFINTSSNNKFDRNAEFSIDGLEFTGSVEYTPVELIEMLKQGGDLVQHLLDLVKNNKQDQKTKKEDRTI